MCIIVHKPAGVDMPTWETLQRCFDANKDGAGFMFRHEGKIEIRKGYLTFDALKVALECEPLLTDVKAMEIGIHFRWATHGNVDATNCHPFPVTTNVGMLRGTCVRAKAALMHNGVIPEFSAVKSDASDTRLFVKVLADMRNIDENASFLLTGRGKFLLMTRTKTIRVGVFEEEAGVFYSNDGYKEVTYVYPGTSDTYTGAAYHSRSMSSESSLYSKKERKRYEKVRVRNPACMLCPRFLEFVTDDCIDMLCPVMDDIIDDDVFGHTQTRDEEPDEEPSTANAPMCDKCQWWPRGEECHAWSYCSGEIDEADKLGDETRAEWEARHALARELEQARERAAVTDAEAKRNGERLLARAKASLPYYTL